MRLLIIEDETDLLRRLTKTIRAESFAVDTVTDAVPFSPLRKGIADDAQGKTQSVADAFADVRRTLRVVD